MFEVWLPQRAHVIAGIASTAGSISGFRLDAKTFLYINSFNPYSGPDELLPLSPFYRSNRHKAIHCLHRSCHYRAKLRPCWSGSSISASNCEAVLSLIWGKKRH